MINSLPPLAVELIRYFGAVLTVAALLVLGVASFWALLRILIVSFKRRMLATGSTTDLAAKLIFASEFLVIAVVLEVLLSPSYLNLTKLAVFTGMRVALGIVRR